MNHIVTLGIVLARTNFQEADRIITVLTPEHGKLRLIAKGVRRPKSKLAGGIELFTVGQLTYLPGKGDIGTLISARLQTHYGDIVKDINRTMKGYELLKRVNKMTEDIVEDNYFAMLQVSLEGLNDLSINLDVWEFWTIMQLLRLSGQTPNLQTDINGRKLESQQSYVFSYDDMAFAVSPAGEPIVAVTKALRLAASGVTLSALARTKGLEKVIDQVANLARTMQQFTLPH